MEWKKTFNRGMWIIHTIFLLLTLSILTAMIFSFRLNQLQTSEEDRRLTLNSLTNHLKKDQIFEKIGKYINRSEPEKANEKIRELSQKVNDIEELLDLKASKDLGLSLRTFNRLINNSLELSSPADALRVLVQKIKNLLDFSTQRNFPKIRQISSRMYDRALTLNLNNVTSSAEFKNLSLDIKKLEEIVAKSALDEGEKTGLNNRFSSMKNEISLLQTLSSHSRDIRAHVTQASLALSDWLLEVEKGTLGLRFRLIEKQNHLILILTSVLGLLTISWMSLLYLFRWQKLRMGEEVEKEVQGVIEKGILADQRFVMDHYSEITREKIIRLLDDLKLKINLGSMLDIGLPFAGCLIDKNFKLTWYNNLFLEQFYLSEEEVRSDSFSWEYLREYFNLKDDPVYSALANNTCGIFPVKIKQDDLTPAQPYEMYVTPVLVNREERVMVFFYPLVSVKEAISEQVHLVKNVLETFIQKWAKDDLNEGELSNLKRDFEKNDSKDLFTNLSDLYHEIKSEKLEQAELITSLEKEKISLQDMIDKTNNAEEKRLESVRKKIQLIHDLRDSFISTFEKLSNLLQINRSVIGMNDDLKNELSKNHQIFSDLTKKINETREILDQTEVIKTDSKKLRLDLVEIKAKLISMNNSLFSQLPPFDENQQKLAIKYKDELAKLDFNVSLIDKKLSQFEVLLAKMKMMHEKRSVETVSFNLMTTQKDHELKEFFTTFERNHKMDEEKIIESFKSLHSLMKKDLTSTHLPPPYLKEAPEHTLLS